MQRIHNAFCDVERHEWIFYLLTYLLT